MKTCAAGAQNLLEKNKEEGRKVVGGKLDGWQASKQTAARSDPDKGWSLDKGGESVHTEVENILGYQ